MIVGSQKPVNEIISLLEPYNRILILGCGTCVKTCFAGGEDEVAVLASALRLSFAKMARPLELQEMTIERQCENEFIQEAAQAVGGCSAVLSLACGAGVQALARRFPGSVILPGVNTTFIGVLERPGVFTEACSGCGNCSLALFGAICPITRCAKKLLNGPCGGSRNGICEVGNDTPCAWHLILERLTAIGRLDSLNAHIPPRNWNTGLAGGPRALIREDHIL